ncbi:endocuticle structural glycoprotein SgAbd-8 [Aethina tumida]|uniref:endocuticle structural glycoprotein SgAbd-8 n=1 Tax=Aethina tumida TaxID=116153 RepID=UPI00096B1ADE|nr:endocuticle structural glycoprotein SgAbd-8 [Aethina tumida]
MFSFGVKVLFLASCALARPQLDAQQQNSGNTTPIPIINQTEETGPDGSVNFSYETGNGISVQENLFTKKDDRVRGTAEDPENPTGGLIQVIQGTFSYTAPDGQVITLRYTADENGFQPQGDHLPTPPPVPQEIADAVSALQNQLQQQGQQPQVQQQFGQQPQVQQQFGQQPLGQQPQFS